MNFFQLIYRLVWSAAEIPFRAIKLWLIEKSCLDRIDGIAICDISTASSTPEAFLNLTRDALALIREHDPRRYHRVCQEIRYIVNRPLISAANYERQGRICNVDYNKQFTSDSQEWNLRAYACLIIHEATHGLLHKKGIAYDQKNRQRIEKLCCLEEYRFAKRIDEWWADEYLSPKRFDSTRWNLYWESRGVWQRAWRQRLEDWRGELHKKKRESFWEQRFEYLKRKNKRLF